MLALLEVNNKSNSFKRIIKLAELKLTLKLTLRKKKAKEINLSLIASTLALANKATKQAKITLKKKDKSKKKAINPLQSPARA